ncbi:cation-transporting P-type ATPase [Haliscomenobacter sp.]|uniref:cation-translocating P-type ATPase n=1 Tax=Haliscomenobacter sp. TaxID=2717303 RepID=UPI003364FB0D
MVKVNKKKTIDKSDVPIWASQETELFTHLGANIEQGLSVAEVATRLEVFGPNTIAQDKQIPAWKLFLRQFKSPLVVLLVIAAGASFGFQEWLDGIAILVVVFLNAIIGFYMEFQAGRSMAALKKMVAVSAKAFRGGSLKEISIEMLVPGDVIYLEAGDMTPADARLFNSSQLQVDEASLTGESVPVEKEPAALPTDTPLAEQSNLLFKGTFVTKGNGKAVVVGTGMNTELGKIAHLIGSSEQAATPLEKKLEAFSGRLIKITIGLVVVIFAAGVIGGKPILEMFQTTIALAVAAVPEGLSIVATLALAQGMLKLARHKVIVRKLAAVETLGGTTVICTDKTGTLTQNKLEVEALAAPGGTWAKSDDAADVPLGHLPEMQYRRLLQIAILCNNSEIHAQKRKIKEIGDPLETGLLKFARRLGEDINELRHKSPKLSEMPFSSETKIMATLHETSEGKLVFAKGAAEDLLDCCSFLLDGDKNTPMSPKARKAWLAEAEKMASSGLKVIAGAFKPDAKPGLELAENLTFVGLFGLIDPPRREIPAAIRHCREAGIEVVMVTGDHPATAKAIGRQLGIIDADETDVVLGKEMPDFEKLSAADKSRWAAAKIFARVSPKQKLDLIRVFQERKAIVGMTGDGVNDAPALKKADIGIAMGKRGTQVAQDVADMVLRDDSFASIVVAIRQGRIIFDNIRKFVIYLLSCNLSELAIIAIVSMLLLDFQLKPLQILFINLVTDVLPALALGVTPGGSEVMKQKPRDVNEPIIDKSRWGRIFFYAAIITATTIGAVYFSYYTLHAWEEWNPALYNNILFFTLIFAQLFHVFNMGSMDLPFWRTEVVRNRCVWFAVGGCALIVAVLYQIAPVRKALSIVPMSVADWALSIGAGLLAMVVIRLLRNLKFFQYEKQ